MQIDANLQSPDIEDAGELAATAEEMGFDGLWVTETTHSPFTLTTRMAEATSSVDIGTSIAVAFPRSPMVTSYTAWDVQNLSDGRFILGLGTQVKGHIERRFSEEWDSPGPRLRDYVRSLQSIWDSWVREEDVDYHGDFYEFDLCPPDWRPDPIDHPEVPIYVAGVNSFNIQLAGHLCEGLHVHPVHSPEYVEQEVVPDVTRGAARADRNPDDVSLTATLFAIVGDDEGTREAARESVRRQIAFYGSTRSYKRIFAVHGWEDICDDLHELSVTDRWEEMPELVTDEMVDAFSVEGRWDELRDVIEERYTHIDRVSLYTPFDGSEQWRALTD